MAKSRCDAPGLYGVRSAFRVRLNIAWLAVAINNHGMRVSFLRNAFRRVNHRIESMNIRLLPLKTGALLAISAAVVSLGITPARDGSLFASPRAGDYSIPAKEVARKSAPPPLKELAVPFRVGETLNYRVTWAAFATAASLQVTVPERRNLFGWATWHFRATLHTQNPVRTLFTIDDEFDSYADASTLETHQYEGYLNELGRKDAYVLHFVPVGQASRAAGTDVRVLPGTRDPVGILYALRGVDWQRTPEFRAPLYDGHDIYQVSARLEARSDAVTVAAGNFPASRIAVRLSQKDKQVADINFELWLANNSTRTPVQFQAALPFGSVRAELTAATKLFGFSARKLIFGDDPVFGRKIDLPESRRGLGEFNSRLRFSGLSVAHMDDAAFE
jgi:hypothetical protein